MKQTLYQNLGTLIVKHGLPEVLDRLIAILEDERAIIPELHELNNKIVLLLEEARDKALLLPDDPQNIAK